MAVTDAWTDPVSLDLNTGQVLPETVWDNLVSNLLYLSARQVVRWINRTGSTVGTGDVVVVDAANDASFVATTTAGHQAVLGVALGTTAANAAGDVVVAGAAQVRTAGAVGRGQYLATSTTALCAAGANDPGPGTFALAASGVGAAGYVTAFVRPAALLPVLANQQALRGRLADGTVADLLSVDANNRARLGSLAAVLTANVLVTGQGAGVGLLFDDGAGAQLFRLTRQSAVASNDQWFDSWGGFGWVVGNTTANPKTAAGDLAARLSAAGLEVRTVPLLPSTAVAGHTVPVRLGRVVLGSPAASITLASIPQTFSHLRMVLHAMEVAGGMDTRARMRFNGDAGLNYEYAHDGTAYSNSASGAQLGHVFITGMGNDGAFSSTTVVVPEYASTSHQKCGHAVYDDPLLLSSRTEVGLSGFRWRSTAAITSVTFVLDSGSNFETGTTLTVYGEP